MTTTTAAAMAISVRGLRKTYGVLAAVDGLVTHLLRVFAKLGVDDRTRAVMLAHERGLLG